MQERAEEEQEREALMRGKGGGRVEREALIHGKGRGRVGEKGKREDAKILEDAQKHMLQ